MPGKRGEIGGGSDGKSKSNTPAYVLTWRVPEVWRKGSPGPCSEREGPLVCVVGTVGRMSFVGVPLIGGTVRMQAVGRTHGGPFVKVNAGRGFVKVNGSEDFVKVNAAGISVKVNAGSDFVKVNDRPNVPEREHFGQIRAVFALLIPDGIIKMASIHNIRKTKWPRSIIFDWMTGSAVASAGHLLRSAPALLPRPFQIL